MAPYHEQILGTIFLIILSHQSSALLLCNELLNLNNCSCSTFYETMIDCPGDAKPKISITISPKDEVTLACMKRGGSYLDMNLIPDINLSNIDILTISSCFVNSCFINISQYFNMPPLRLLVLENVAAGELITNPTFLQDNFQHMEKLRELSIKYSNIYGQRDFLLNTPNLLKLTLTSNEITDFDVNLRYVSKLQELDLSANYINVLHAGVFTNLLELTFLDLTSNKLTSLSRNLFTKLTNLKSLKLDFNVISNIPEDTFADLKSLALLNLLDNKIFKTSRLLFAHKPLLENINLGFNPNIVLDDYLFANLSQLRIVSLVRNNLKSIPENFFLGSSNLREINLHDNNLQTISNKIFNGLHKLRRLQLSSNNLSILSSSVFSSLSDLEELSLDNNKLTEISHFLFENLGSLKSLYLQENEIWFIDPKALVKQSYNLINLNLSGNKWNNSYMKNESSPIDFLPMIQSLDLRYNKLKMIPKLDQLFLLKKIYLKSNQISSFEPLRPARDGLIIDLSDNQIKVVPNPTKLKKYFNNHIILDGNPIICDCSNFDLVQYILYNQTMLYFYEENNLYFNPTNLFCADSKTRVSDLKLKDINCVVDDGCPSYCACRYTPYNTAVIVDCSHRGLTDYPIIKIEVNDMQPYNQTILLLNGNNLTIGPVALPQSVYDTIANLNLSDNLITKINWIPPRIEVLDLSQNRLTTIGSDFLDRLQKSSTLKSIRLKSNPWECTCDLLHLQNFLVDNIHKVTASDVFCENTHQELVKVTSLCHTTPYLTIILPVMLTLLLFFAICIALYYRYQTEIKIYLYSKNLFTWCFAEEYLDPNKEFDAFISFSNKDVDFVADLINELENGEISFAICHHAKDWLVGGSILENIIQSIDMSRRTIIVLTNNFLDSHWASTEFVMAHTKAMKDATTRVIIIIYGDLNRERLNSNEHLKELNSYLNTNTYLEWGEKYFWSKLRYALPHK